MWLFVISSCDDGWTSFIVWLYRIAARTNLANTHIHTLRIHMVFLLLIIILQIMLLCPVHCPQNFTYLYFDLCFTLLDAFVDFDNLFAFLLVYIFLSAAGSTTSIQKSIINFAKWVEKNTFFCAACFLFYFIFHFTKFKIFSILWAGWRIRHELAWRKWIIYT